MLSLLRKPVERDEVELARKIERGDRANALLKDDLLAEAFASVEGVYMDAWRNSDMLDVEKRERCHVAVLILGDLKNQLISYVRDGAVARREMEKSLR